jgi:hypothetical protein
LRAQLDADRSDLEEQRRDLHEEQQRFAAIAPRGGEEASLQPESASEPEAPAASEFNRIIASLGSDDEQPAIAEAAMAEAEFADAEVAEPIVAEAAEPVAAAVSDEEPAEPDVEPFVEPAIAAESEPVVQSPVSELVEEAPAVDDHTTPAPELPEGIDCSFASELDALLFAPAPAEEPVAAPPSAFSRDYAAEPVQDVVSEIAETLVEPTPEETTENDDWSSCLRDLNDLTASHQAIVSGTPGVHAAEPQPTAELPADPVAADSAPSSWDSGPPAVEEAVRGFAEEEPEAAPSGDGMPDTRALLSEMFGIRLSGNAAAESEAPAAAAEPTESIPSAPAPASADEASDTMGLTTASLRSYVPETPAPAPARAARQADEDFSLDDADPDSIAAYMQRLLARNRRQDHFTEDAPIARTAPENKPAAEKKPAQEEASTGLDTARWMAARNAPAPEAAPAAEAAMAAATRINPLPPEFEAQAAARTAAEPEAESPADIMRPKYQRDQLRAGLDSMREVANLSARAAIAKCNWKRMRMQVAFTSGITACSLATTVALLSSPLWASVSYMKYGLISAGLTALAGAELFRNVWKIYGPQISHRKARKDEDEAAADEADHASEEESPAPEMSAEQAEAPQSATPAETETDAPAEA